MLLDSGYILAPNKNLVEIQVTYQSYGSKSVVVSTVPLKSLSSFVPEIVPFVSC